MTKFFPQQNFNALDVSQSFVGLHISQPTWYADTGTSHHMTNYYKNLDFYKPYTSPDSVKVGDGAFPISHIGKKVLRTSLSSSILHEVLLVP